MIETETLMMTTRRRMMFKPFSQTAILQLKEHNFDNKNNTNEDNANVPVSSLLG